MQEKQNAIIYVRVSSLEQVDGTSLEMQERLCKEYAERENLVVSGIFIEKGESAKTAERTEFIKAISYCSEKKNRIKYFIVYKIDRFSRNQTDYAVIKQKLKKYGTEIRSVSEKIDDTPTGKLMETILSSFAEFDNNVRTERSVGGMKEKIKKGIWVWQAPLGYCRTEVKGNIVPDPKLAPYVKLAFEEYAKGTYTYQSLAQFLNENGFVSRYGKPVIFQVVEKMLKNPIYCGIIRVWDTETKGTFEPIIDENLYYLCQKGGTKGRNIKHLKTNTDFPLRKLVTCQFCNDPLTGSHSTGRKGIKYPYYHHHKQNCDYAKSIPKENFEQIFVEYLNEINPSMEYEKAFKAIVIDIWKNNCKGFDSQNQEIRKEIETLEQHRQRIFELHQAKTYTDEEFIAQKTIVSKKIAEKESMIHDKRIEEFNMEEALEYCFNEIRDTSKTWLKYAKEPEKRIWFQNFIFEENLPFSGEKFGTAKLTPIYNIYQEYLRDPSSLVTPQRIEL